MNDARLQPQPKSEHADPQPSRAERGAAKILRLKQVMERTGFGRSWIYKSMKAGTFVPSVKIGRATGWDAAAVDAWIVEKLEAGSVNTGAAK